MINKVKGGYLLLKHNYEYGFSRNLWSSSIFGLVGSLILLYISIANNNESMMTISISFGLVYLLYISFGFLLIKYVGKLYARKLIEEYYEN
jgi:ABC-type Mn2+/Zn2+ transport system permease subunit